VNEPDRQSRAPRHFRLKRGLDLAIAGAPSSEAIEDAPPVGSVALLGADAPGVRPELKVAPGDRVRLGQTLWVDRHRPEVRFTAPGAGRVRSVERGARRRLEAVVIDLEGDDAESFEPVASDDVPGLPRERLRTLLLASGLWTALRTRPFSRIPDPDQTPHSLFVTALDSEPLAPPAESILRADREAFALGVAGLTRLTEGPVHVCVRPGAEALAPDLEGVRVATFAGPHPAGLPGTHIHLLEPAGQDRAVWHVGYPDVIALGRLLATGRLPTERVVSLAGPAMMRPRLVRTRLGASTNDLVRDQLRDERCRVLSGSALAGHHAVGWGAYLGRTHRQVCALPEDDAGAGWGWLAPRRGGRARRILGSLQPRRPTGAFTTSLHGRRGAFYPLERLERVVPLDLWVAPLLRALLVGDLGAAEELGVLELAEEDLALVSFLCPAKLEYGALLRTALDEIEKARA
jgi:Na+-transporting NADH:ubiquinone oxidoreductase subunit A